MAQERRRRYEVIDFYLGKNNENEDKIFELLNTSQSEDQIIFLLIYLSSITRHLMKVPN